MGLILQDSDTNDASTNTDKDLLMSDDELTSVHGNGDLTVAYKSLKMTNQWVLIDLSIYLVYTVWWW